VGDVVGLTALLALTVAVLLVEDEAVTVAVYEAVEDVVVFTALLALTVAVLLVL